MSTFSMDAVRQHARTDWPLWLVVAVIALQPIGRLPEIPLLIMALFGLKDLVLNRQVLFSSRSFQLFTGLFLCFWFPALFSLPDAVNLDKGLSTTLGMLRFYFAGVFIVNRVTSKADHRWIAYAAVIIVTFWALDGVVELVRGKDLFGLSSGSSLYITGIYGDNKRLGYALVAFLGITLAAVRGRLPLALQAAFLLLMLFVIFISGTRMAWLASVWFAVVVFAVLWLSGFRLDKKWWIGGLAGLLLIGGFAMQTPSVQQKVSASLAVFSSSSLDTASSGRISIWDTSVKMFTDNWLNGVGVRGFRYAYADYASGDDMFVHGEEQKLGAYHPHQIVLEMLTEMGLIGLVGLLLACVMMFTLMKKMVGHVESCSFLYLAGIVTLLMPLNTHLSMYSSYWASLFWFLSAMTFAMLRTEQEQGVST